MQTPASAVVETVGGKVRGYVRNGVHTFKGIPYAGPASGAARFLPPQPVAPWSGILPTIAYGPVCHQGVNGQWQSREFKFLLDWDNGINGEDCPVLNVWTKGIGDGGKRPVMVWLHGGGFSGGSAQELPSYDGENIAKRGDVVLVSVNHRLNEQVASLTQARHADRGGAVFAYQFEQGLPGREDAGAQHSYELPYVFGNFATEGMFGGAYGAEDRALSDTLAVYWTNFAKTGDPNGAGLPPWPKYQSAPRPYLRISKATPGFAAVDKGLRQRACALLAKQIGLDK